MGRTLKDRLALTGLAGMEIATLAQIALFGNNESAM